jgi:hypothetical protein
MRLKLIMFKFVIGGLLLSLILLYTVPAVYVYGSNNPSVSLNTYFTCHGDNLVANIDLFLRDISFMEQKSSYLSHIEVISPWGRRYFHIPLSVIGDATSGLYRGTQVIGKCKDGTYKVEVSINDHVRELYTVFVHSSRVKYFADDVAFSPLFLQGVLTASSGVVSFDVFVENKGDATITLSRDDINLNVLLYSGKYLIYSSLYDIDEKYVKYAIRPGKYITIPSGDSRKIAIINIPVKDRKTHKGQFSLSVVATGSPFLGSYLNIPIFEKGLPNDVPDWATDYVLSFENIGVIPWSNLSVPATRKDMAILIGGLYRRFYLFKGVIFTDVSIGEPVFGLLGNLFYMHRVSGYPDGTYRPTVSLSRLEATIFLLKYIYGNSVYEMVSNTQPEGIFKDVSPDKWYAPWLEIAYKQGIVKGYDDGTFRPFDNITRLEVIVMLYRAYLLTK